jgi:hypothetical protein
MEGDNLLEEKDDQNGLGEPTENMDFEAEECSSMSLESNMSIQIHILSWTI